MAIDNVSMEEKIEELKKAMPNQTLFVKGIIEDWIWLVDNKIKDKLSDFEEVVEVLTFNVSGQSAIYEECSGNYSWKNTVNDEDRMKRIEDLLYAKKQHELCYTGSIYVGDIIGSIS